MKAVFLSYNQALTDRVNAILDEQGIRGFTRWALTEGRGSFDGEPHYGTHAWQNYLIRYNPPFLCSLII